MSETFAQTAEQLVDLRILLQAKGLEPSENAQYLDLKKQLLDLITCYLLTEIIHIKYRENRLQEIGDKLEASLEIPSEEKKAKSITEVLKDLKKMPEEMQAKGIGVPTLKNILSALATDLI